MNKNREFKFRIWKKPSLINKYEGWLVNPNPDRTQLVIDVLTGGLFDAIGRYGDVDYRYLEKKENYVIQQFAGLQDKNGKDVYEGDIIKTSYQIYEKRGINTY